MYSITETANNTFSCFKAKEMTRSCIEVSYGSLTPDKQSKDPLDLFVWSLRNCKRGTDEIERTNKRVLSNLISNGHISKSSIIWNDDKISKIYGLRVDNEGRIKYDKHKSPERKQPLYVAADATKVDLSELRNAIIRAKQAAV